MHLRSSTPSSLVRQLVLALCGLLAASIATAADISWLTANSGFWDDGSNWSGAVPPDAGDSALITVAPGVGGYQVLVDADADIDRLELGSGGAGPSFLVDGATFRIMGPTTSEIDSGRSLSVANLAVFRFQGPTVVQSSLSLEGGVGGGGSWFNEAGLTFDGGAAAVYDLDEIFDNSGTLAVDSGTLRISDPLTNSGALQVAAGAEIEFDIGGTVHTLAEGSSLSGAGTITAVGAVNLDVTATTPPTFGAGLTLVLFGGLKGGSVVNDGNLELNGDVLGTGELRNRGLVTVNGDVDAKTLANEATVDILDLDLTGGAVVDNEATGLVTFADATIAGAGSVANAGTLRKASGAGTGSVAVPLTNTGTVEALAGTLDLADFTQTAGTTTVTASLTSSATLDVQGGVLEGTGSVGAAVDLGGTVRAGSGGPGTLTFLSSLSFQPGARLLAEIGGTTAGSGYDQVVVSGTASLDGTLELVLVDGFEPSLGDSFTVLSGTTSGSFASLDLPALQAGLGWQVTSQPVVASVVEDPDLIFADGFESGDTTSWSTTKALLQGLLQGLQATSDAEAVVAGMRVAAGKSLRLQGPVLSARDADGAELFAVDARRHHGTLQVRLQVRLREAAAETGWIDVARGATIALRYRSALPGLDDGAVFLDVGGRLEGWLTDLPVTVPVDHLRYDDRLLVPESD